MTAQPATYDAPKLEFRSAWRALQALIKDPEDTRQVFRIMRALTGKSMWRQYKKFNASDIGQHILKEKIDLLDTLADRASLAKLPQGSLGRAYLSFMIREGITAEGLVEASDDVYAEMTDENVIRFVMRTREMHDLWHVITGYGRDQLGEVCVVAFSYAQTKSLGFAAIALMGAHKLNSEFPGNKVRSAVWQAYRIGQKAEWFSGQNWETLMAQPLDDVRRMLNVSVPTKYQQATNVIANTRPAPVVPAE
ncbi:ubiquinone biosynthesis protein COQ4 [Kordiimonas aquimaris]|uniref:ubiquinone biosynthesis protein COQ4 n=1 Tax=Kordiimonas aquimaris TaxID=707591 RepID=UPI0021D21F3D|nr:ubiquinone biosynthesis protein COQ4 [Kordiimonas aquimaris]